MIPQERGLEGINVYFLLYLPFVLRGRMSYVGFLGRFRRFLIPYELLKPTSGLMRVSDNSLFIPLFTCSLVHSLHPHPCLDLGKGTKFLKISHSIVGCSGRWCDLATT
jgi:hypothetical protein